MSLPFIDLSQKEAVPTSRPRTLRVPGRELLVRGAVFVGAVAAVGGVALGLKGIDDRLPAGCETTGMVLVDEAQAARLDRQNVPFCKATDGKVYVVPGSLDMPDIQATTVAGR